MCGADWAASTEKTEPFCRAISPIAAMSFTVPSTFEACATETIFVFGESLFFKVLHVERAVTEHSRDNELRAGPLRRNLPRNDVGVVLHGGDENFVAAFEILQPPRASRKVEGFRRPAREYGAVFAARAEEFFYFGAR